MGGLCPTRGGGNQQVCSVVPVKKEDVNKPLYYESKQYTWDGIPNYSLMGTNDSYKISDTPPKKEVLVDGKITVSINNTSYADIYIERVCVTTLEITDFLATSQYHGIVISGLVFGFPSTVSMVAVAGNNDIYPLVALIPESFEGIQAGFYFMKGTGLNSGSTIAYCESLQFIDVVVKDEYKHFFDQFENKIKLMKTLGAKKHQIFFKLIFPSSINTIISAFIFSIRNTSTEFIYCWDRECWSQTIISN